MIKLIYWLKRPNGLYMRRIQLAILVALLAFVHFSYGSSFSGSYEILHTTVMESRPLGVINGLVTNTKGEPLAGVTILLKGTTKGVTTGADGKYSIDAPDDGVLVFRYLGFVTQEIAIHSRAHIDVQLTADVNSLNGVVVTALGIKRQSRSLAYGVQQLSNSDVNQVPDPSSNIMNALSGKVAGAVITPAASGPGGAVRVVLRGNRSINGNNNALIVVDGVPIDNTMTTELNGGGSANTIATQPKSISSSYSGSDGAASINPEDVESISILAGPAAAALYGSRAANGAILITTKSGKSGSLSVNYNGGVSFDVPNMLMKFQNTYGRGDQGQNVATAGGSWGAADKTYPNNVRDFYNTGATVNNYVSVTGGTDKIKGYASYTNNAVSGIIPKNGLNRNTVDLRVTAQVLPKLSTDVKMTYVNRTINNEPRLGDQGINNEAYIMPRDLSSDSLKNYERFDVNGKPIPVYWTSSSTFQNPYWDVYRNSLDEERNRVMLMASAKYQFTNWLSLQGRYSLDRYDDKITSSYYDGTVAFPVNPGGRYLEAYLNHWQRNIDLLLSGSNTLSSNFNISYNIGGSVLDIKGYNTQDLANGLSIPNKFNLNFATSPSYSNVAVKKEVQSVYGNAELSFKEYLYLDISGRNDWSSTLPSPYSFFYPSIGISAILSDMFVMPSWISFAKIRGSYTQVGNDADPYLLQQTYSYNQGSGNGFVTRDGTKAINNLKPEQTKSYEAGLDWRFLNGRLGLSATIYKTNSINQLISINLPRASGFSDEYINAGNIENKGLEITLSVTPINGKIFNWDSKLNFATNKNKVLSLAPGVSQVDLSTGNDNFGSLLIKPGGSYGDIYDYVWARDPKTGSHLVTAAGLPEVTPLQKLGNFNPDFTLGWDNDFTYKRFDLSFLIDGSVGGILVSGTDAMMAYYGVSEYTTKFRNGGLILQGVHDDGTPNTSSISAEQLWTNVSQGGRSGYGQFFAYHGTTFRLREFSLGYRFNVHHTFLKDAKISLTGRNLFFLYRGKSLLDIPGIGNRTLPVDPESAIGTSNYQGVESGLPPSLRSIGLNVNLSF